MLDGVGVYQYRRRKDNQEKLDELRFSAGSGDSRHKRNIYRLTIKSVTGVLLLSAAGFLLGRSAVLGELFPFGPAMVAAAFAFYRGAALPALLGAIGGLFSVTAGWDLVVRVMSLAITGMAVLSLPARVGVHSFLMGGTVFAVMVVTGTGYVALTGPSNYDYIRVLFESIFGFLFAVAFYKAFSGLGQVVRRERLPADGLFCLVLLLVSVIAAAGQVQWGYISPGGLLAGLAVLVAGYVGGGGLGASAGAVMGVLPGLVYAISPAAAGAAAFAGLLGGLGRALGRPGVVAGFLLGNILLTVYLGSGRDIVSVLGESASAALVFLFLPAVVLNGLRTYLPVVQPWDLTGSAGQEAREDEAAKRLKHWSRVLEEISRSYERAGGSGAPGKKDRSRVGPVDELKEMVCSGCPVHRLCWEKEGKRTRAHLQGLMDAAEQTKSLDIERLDTDFYRHCSRAGEMAVGAGCLSRLQRMRVFWENCLRESRELVSGHMRGMRGVVEHLAREMEAGKENWRQREEFYKRELKQAGMPVSSLILYPGTGNCEVEVTMPACGGMKKCRYDVAPLLSRFIGDNLATAFLDCMCRGKEDFCTFRLYPGLKYGLRLGLAGATAGGNQVSGDSYAVLQLGGGRVVAMISDGMGAGPVAAAESGTTLALLKQLLRAGFSGEPAIRTVNSVMIRRSPEDTFATVDMLVVDLYAGEAEIIKTGAAPSFWVRQGRVDIVRSASLPVGIVEEIKMFYENKKISFGDMLIMATDGVADAHRGEGEKEEWVAGLLGEIIDLPPAEVAELVVKLARGGDGRRVADDMTVVAVRVEENGQ